ncbi:hypothetical protein [Nocardiopsis sp. CC223A]|uniref:hypothetical protein n=1 Tax=Nocardiopsis sp. CC223A TaxID=3044051 RepID=UPI002795F490|nr:hypothetical protein [Nocardiopsis sp. CC223A]
MERIAVSPEMWSRLMAGTADLSRTAQASLMTLRLLMSSSGSVRNAIAHLVALTARSRSTISEHLGAAQAGGWLACLQRGGNRADGPAASVYQATVPLEVWQRREELLAVFAQEPDQADLPVFSEGSVIPAQAHRGPTSEFSAQKINPSIPQEEMPTWSATQSSAIAPGTDPVVAAVIEELAALTGQLVSPAWAARCVSQILRHRRVRHPIAYLVKTLQNAAEDGTLVERFMPREELRASGSDRQSTSPPVVKTHPPKPRPAPAAPSGVHWDAAGFEQDLSWPDEGPPSASALIATTPEKDDTTAIDTPPQEIYRPGGRILAGLGQTGAEELLKLRQQFAERKKIRSNGSEPRKDSSSRLDLVA